MHKTIDFQIIEIKNKLVVKKFHANLLLHVCYTHCPLYPTWFVHPYTV